MCRTKPVIYQMNKLLLYLSKHGILIHILTQRHKLFATAMRTVIEIWRITLVFRQLSFSFEDDSKICILELIVFNFGIRVAGEVEQSIDVPWSVPEDYNANNEARLLRNDNAAEETLINSTRYDLENEDKYIDIGYSTHLDLQPVIRIRDGATGCENSRCNARFSKNNVFLDTYQWEKFTELEPHMMNQFFYDSSEIQRVFDESCKDELSIRNMCKTDDITDDVTISYHWEYSKAYLHRWDR
ncbi:hypothetical protein FQA39_LY15598 [Lamprigera yunnana]|nr:hypothetical protein FQA39_LY15598 [Lamprigera yunnana]